VTKPGQTDHLVLRLQLTDPSCGGLGPLMKILRIGGVAADAVPDGNASSSEASGESGQLALPPPAAVAQPSEAAGRARRAAALEQDESSHGSEPGSPAARRHGQGSPDKGADRVTEREEHEEERRQARGGHHRHGRVAEWVHQASGLPDSEAEDSGSGDGAYHHQRGGHGKASSSNCDTQEPSGGGHHHRAIPRGNRSMKDGGRSQRGVGRGSGHEDEEEGSEADFRERSRGRSRVGPDKEDSGASEHSAGAAGFGNGAASLGGAMAASAGYASSQQSGSEVQDASSIGGADMADNSELVADFRWANWRATQHWEAVEPCNERCMIRRVVGSCLQAGDTVFGNMVGSRSHGGQNLWAHAHAKHDAALNPHTFHGYLSPRRAKRLKKLTRLFTSTTAQSATTRFRQRTWLITFIILGAHLAAFAVLVTQIESRYA
jgi:hypothetical protein